MLLATWVYRRKTAGLSPILALSGNQPSHTQIE
jgi:hypothetical protein